MTRASNQDALAIGAEPRVDLLPPEVRAQAKGRQVSRMLVFALVGVVVIVGAGIGAVTITTRQAQERLSAEQARTQDLLAEQAKYGPIRQMQGDIVAAKAAQEVGSATEIDWRDYLLKVRATLPAGLTIDTVNIDAESPIAAYTQASVPLQGARVATLSFAVTSPTLPDVHSWLDRLATLPGFVDALPGALSQTAPTGAYSVTLVMHINQEAFSNRFSAAVAK